jgi:hypothetical protein
LFSDEAFGGMVRMIRRTPAALDEGECNGRMIGMIRRRRG